MTIEESIRQACACIPNTSEVVFLVGAGLSVSAHFPLWKDASEIALKRAELAGLNPGASQYAREKLGARDFYALFSILRAELTATMYREITLKAFDGVHSASNTQRLLLGVNARGIITTNFDQCLTSAAVQVKGEPPLQSMSEALASDRYFVVKPHGNLYEPDTMVLTTTDWQRVLERGELRDLLEQIVNRNQLVILGYSMSDPDFNSIWSDLLVSRVFRHPALYCCSQGSLTPARLSELRDKDIHVIQFDDPGDFSYLDKLLQGIAGLVSHVSTAASAEPKIAASISELERYVSLFLEFSDEHKSRLELVTKAIILEMLSEHTQKASRSDILTFAVNVLGQQSSSIENALTSALASLCKSGTILNMKDSFTLEDAAKAQLAARVKQAEREENATLQRLLVEAGTRHNVSASALSEGIFRELVDRALVSLGLTVAEFFLYGKSTAIVGEQLEAFLDSIPASSNLSNAQRYAYLDALRNFVIQPSPKDEKVVFRRIQAYFITTAFVLSPTSDRLLAEYASGHIIYLDASVILPAMANGHSSQALYRGLLSDTRRLGMKLRVSTEMVNEIFANLRAARSAFGRFSRGGLNLKDVLSGYMALQGLGNGNVFLEGFLAQLELDPSVTPETYLDTVMDGTAANSERELAEVLSRRFDIELDAWSAADFDKGELERLTDSIAYLRKMGNRFKTVLLCKHEALQFALLHTRRSEHPELKNKIWFVTTDYFFVELQRLERAKYPLPVSYTPRLWFQYLDLIDTEARGSKHFSRLQTRMRYGVAIGDFGMNTINLILREKKDLISQGLVSVKEMAESIVENYHVKKSIEAYEYGAKSGADVSRQDVTKSIRDAISGLVTVKTQELESLKEGKAKAEARVEELAKQSKKDKYTIGYLKRGAKRKKRRRR